MFERFTSQARSAVIRAQEEARRLRHPRVGTGHLLLGILGTETGAGARVLIGLHLDLVGGRATLARLVDPAPGAFAPHDVEALRSFGIDLDEVRRTLEGSFGPGALDRVGPRRASRRHIPFASDSKGVLELSLREALRLGHRYIGSEHILLGLVRDPGSTATQILQERGITAEQVRQAVHHEMAGGGERPDRTA